MSIVQIYGVPPSSYVRTARMTCVEKGAEHTLEVEALGSEEHQTRHPFARVPALKHGNVSLFETLAITEYLDCAFDGPSLVPTDPADAGTMYQWISTLNCYAYDDLVVRYLLPFIRGQMDDAKWEAARKNVQRDLELLDKALEGRNFIAGDQLSLADLFWGPVAVALPQLPHTAPIAGQCKNIGPWLGRLMERKSAEFLLPPQS